MENKKPEEILSEITGIPVYRILKDDGGEYITKKAALMAINQYGKQLEDNHNQTLREAQVLTGEDAERFLENMNNPKPISLEEKERMKEAYKMVQLMEHGKICRHCDKKVIMISLGEMCPNCNCD